MNAAMHLTFKIEGGAAHFPGLARPVEIHTKDLLPEEAEDLERKVRNTRLLDRPAERGGGGDPEPSPDARNYVLTVRHEGRQRTVMVREPVEDEALGELLAVLRRHQRRRRTTR